MIINHNMNAMNAHRNMGMNTVNSGKSMEKLSSGLRINRAGDDAAGLAISEKMRGQIRGLDQAGRNAQDSISMIQTAEGALNETHSILQRMRELSVQAANDTNVANDREAIKTEMEQLKTEINRISTDTEFNTRKLLNGDISKATTAKAQTFKLASATLNMGTGATGVLTAASKLVDLKDGNGNTIGLQAGDKITIRGAVGGTIKTASIVVSATGTVSAILKQLSAAFGAKKAIVSAGVLAVKTTTGLSAAIGGLSITAADKNGNTRAAFNNAFGKLTQTQSAANAAADGKLIMQIGANANQNIDIDVNSMDATSLGVNAVSVDSSTAAQVSTTLINNAIVSVSNERSKLGAFQNRLEHTIANLGTSSENLQAAESRVRDVDMAKEMMNFSKNNILSQASQAMLAQAKSQPEGVLQLLR